MNLRLLILALPLVAFSCSESEESTNQLCQIEALDEIFAIREHEPNETIVGTVDATADNEAQLSYSIVSGNQDNVFAINSASGLITVNNSADLDFEKIQQFILGVEVDSPLCRTAMVNITINVVDIDDTING